MRKKKNLTVMADTQVLEHSVGRGLGHENRLLWRMPHVCELCVSTVAVERHRRESRAVAVESFRKIALRDNSTLFLTFIFQFVFRFFSR